MLVNYESNVLLTWREIIKNLQKLLLLEFLQLDYLVPGIFTYAYKYLLSVPKRVWNIVIYIGTREFLRLCGPGTWSMRYDHTSSICYEMGIAAWLRQCPGSRLLGSNEQACFWDFSFPSLNAYIFTITAAIHLYTHWMSWHKASRKIPTYINKYHKILMRLYFIILQWC